MSELSPGTIDRFKVKCWRCAVIRSFFPPHELVYRARIHARALGWFFLDGEGWECPGCYHSQKRKRADKVQVTLPGFGVLSRNQAKRFK